MWDLDAQPDQEVSLVELAVGHWLYWMQFAEANDRTYHRVLVPLDQTGEAERVLSRAEKLLASEGEGILLHIIPTEGPGSASGERVRRGVGADRQDRAQAMNYLQGVASSIEDRSNRWRCDVIESPSVADGVAGVRRAGRGRSYCYVHPRSQGASKAYQGEHRGQCTA